MICPKCNIKLPVFNDNGMHNFCPTALDNGQVVAICMTCKMDEVKKR